mgnify:CR=1 FL=1|tara:strand:- start:6917 stop:7297 length:381 start_codon:yes stop_codon:yes gene_type:complete
MTFDWEHLATIVATLIGALSSERAWRYFHSKREDAKEDKQIKREDHNLYRDDLRKEVSRLRDDMVKLYEERDQERKEYAEQFADVKAQLAMFKTRVEHLEQENASLRVRLTAIKQKAAEQGIEILD